jgi:phage shock protein C
MQAQTITGSPARAARLIGVCASLGEDFGFNPDYLRVALTFALLWNPEVVLGLYTATALLVLLSRWLAPRRKAAPIAALQAQDAGGSNFAAEPIAVETELARAA